MEITQTQAPAITPDTIKSQAYSAENTNLPNAAAQNEKAASNTTDTVDISPAAAKLAASDNDSANRINNATEAQQTTQAIQQSNAAELLRVQGNPPSSHVIANLLG